MSLEKSLIIHCAPTLASIKPASLFTIEEDSCRKLDGELRQWNRILSPKGLSLCVLRRSGRTALVYVYRRSHLLKSLECPETSAFLRSYGYERMTISGVLRQLIKRLEKCEGFPHEIGAFLGYPLEDVVGFIENEGRNCKCAGCWKVYGDAAQAERRFAQYRKCHCVYRRLWDEGRSVLQLTVAA